MRIKRSFVLAAPILALCLFLQGCGPGLIAGFRIAFASSRPFVQSLVPGVISQGKADVVTHDVGDGITAAEKGETCIKTITVSGPAKRVAQAKCYYTAAQDLRVILDRHNIGGVSQLDQIATIVSGAIEAFEAYYTAINTGSEVTGPDGGITHTGADGIAGEDADKQLERALKDLDRQLKQVTENH